MRRVGRLLVIAAALAGLRGPATAAPAPVSAKPMRILSMSLCTDLLLLQLAPRSRIAGVTYLAHDGAEVLFPGADAGIPIDHGTPEDIINLKPDLILAGDFSTALTRTLARRVGARLVEVKSATSFADIRANLRQLGAELGEPRRAEALVQRMDATLGELAATAPTQPMRVVVWSGGTTVPGRDTLTDAIVTAAGARNIAALPGPGDSTFGVEDLLAARPQALLYGAARPGVRSLTTDEGSHRAVRRLYAGRRIAFNGIVHACGLPQSADSARDLRRALGLIGVEFNPATQNQASLPLDGYGVHGSGSWGAMALYSSPIGGGGPCGTQGGGGLQDRSTRWSAPSTPLRAVPLPLRVRRNVSLAAYPNDFGASRRPRWGGGVASETPQSTRVGADLRPSPHHTANTTIPSLPPSRRKGRETGEGG